jgi:hypothetical protein
LDSTHKRTGFRTRFLNCVICYWHLIIGKEKKMVFRSTISKCLLLLSIPYIEWNPNCTCKYSTKHGLKEKDVKNVTVSISNIPNVDRGESYGITIYWVRFLVSSSNLIFLFFIFLKKFHKSYVTILCKRLVKLVKIKIILM